MDEDIRKILVLLNEIKKDIEDIKRNVGSDKDDGRERQQAVRISTGPATTAYTKIKDKTDWDSASIDGLIE